MAGQQDPIQPIHPQILKHNVRAGDFVAISPDKEKENERTFLVAKVDGDEIFIHPGSRPSQMKVLTPGPNPNDWILKSNIIGEKINDWSYEPRDEWDPVTSEVMEIRIAGSDRDLRAIQFMSQEDDKSMDYRQIKGLIIEHVNVFEKDDKRPIRRYKVSNDKLKYSHYHGFEEDLQIDARTFMGARITYMNWLDTQNVKVNDKDMWDQLDQFLFNPKKYENKDDEDYDPIEDVAFEFDSGDFEALEQMSDEVTVLSYPGPQTSMIKAVRN